jgi:hypothetical protein
MRKSVLVFSLCLLSTAAFGQAFTGPASITQPVTANNCAKFAISGGSRLVDSGAPCGTSSAVGANPTATIGAAAVNGVSTNFMRADGAPALPATLPALNGSLLTAVNAATLGGSALGTSGATVPLLNGTNIWSGNNGITKTNPTFTITASNNGGTAKFSIVENNSGGTPNNWDIGVSIQGDDIFEIYSGTLAGDVFRANKTTGAITLPTGGLSVGAPTGGAQGTGSVNAVSYYANGTVGLTLVCTVIPTAITITAGIITAVTGGTCS